MRNVLYQIDTRYQIGTRPATEVQHSCVVQGVGVLILGRLVSGNQPSSMLPSLALVYHAIDAVILCLCNTSLICATPACTSCSKNFQVDGRYATSVESTPYLVQICCMVASATSAGSNSPIE